MSSTARWGQREPTDYYATPQGAIVTFLDSFLQTPEGNKLLQPYPQEKLLRTDLKILDPCAGWNPEYNKIIPIESHNEKDIKKQEKELRKFYNTVRRDGNMFNCRRNVYKMSYPTVLWDYWAINIVTNDIREDSPATHHKDFVSVPTQDNIYDFVITNPPFVFAQQFIINSLKLVKEWGMVVMLLRLNYFWAECREDFWKDNMPTYAYIHRKRIGFTPDNSSDSIEYMHAVWIKWQNPEFSKLKII